MGLLATLSIMTLSIECRSAECNYDECRYAEWCHTDCRYADCRYAKRLRRFIYLDMWSLFKVKFSLKVYLQVRFQGVILH